MRQVITLDGQWEVAEGDASEPPLDFRHTLCVPGLLDMAVPSFADVGLLSPLREAFWCRREFDIDDAIPEIGILRVGKARYGTKVWLNGIEVGEHPQNHTAGEFDVGTAVHSGRNEVLIRLGAWRDDEPTAIPDGRDVEAYLAVPGIYDSVELILGSYPYIDLVRTAPNVDAGTVKAFVRLCSGATPETFNLTAKASESGSRVGCGVAEVSTVVMEPYETREVELEIPIDAPRLWSPEDPFLYDLLIATPSDESRTRFGLRSFTFDRASGQALLNGNPYPLRGSASALFRFFEDPDRGHRPWDRKWVRKLHRQFKAMHWNTIRYAIGFPPELWYEVADEEGLLVIDEFPLFYIYLADDAPAVEAALALAPGLKAHALHSIATGSSDTAPPRTTWPEPLTADALEPEFREWMEQRCNHPSVIMFSSNCEGRTPETGKLIQKIRSLDPQGRPWADGWNQPPTDSDPYIAHWYLQWNSIMRKEPPGLEMLSTMRKSPIGYPLGGDPEQLLPFLRTPNRDFDGVPANDMGNAVILEEFGWLWLTRDGNPTRLTERVYGELEGWPTATPQERQYTRARLVAAETEFFRCNRAMAGVLLFCALSSSHDRVSTADSFTDVDSLNYEPNFFRYVRDAFSPVALMIDLWDREIQGGVLHEIRVVAINDLAEEWVGDVLLRVEDPSTGNTVQSQRRRIRLANLGQVTLYFGLTQVIPQGEYQIVAELLGDDGYKVQSVRDVRVIPLGI